MFIQTESPIPTQPPKNAFNSQLKKQTECSNWLNLWGGFDPLWRRVTKWNQGKSACSPSAHGLCWRIIFTKNAECYKQLGVASWLLELDNGCFLQCTAVQNDWAAASVSEPLGIFRLVLERPAPFECLDLGALEGLNFHKVLNADVLKNRMLEVCRLKNLTCWLFQNVCSSISFSNVKPRIFKKLIKYRQTPRH